MPTYTTTADPVSGEFNIELPAALVGGEKVKVTAQKNGQTRSLNLQAPSEPYLPPGGGSGGENGSGSGGNSTDGNGLIVSDDGKFALLANFPFTTEIARSYHNNIEEDGSDDKTIYNRNLTIRKVADTYLIKPHIPANQADATSLVAYVGLRVKKSDLIGLGGLTKVYQIARGGGWVGNNPLSSDDAFDQEIFTFNYNRNDWRYQSTEGYNASSDIDYLYVVIKINFSVKNGVYNYSYSSIDPETNKPKYLEYEYTCMVLGSRFKVKLDV